MTNLLKGLRQPWLIWVQMNLNIYKQGEVHPKNCLGMLNVEEVYESEHVRTSTK